MKKAGFKSLRAHQSRRKARTCLEQAILIAGMTCRAASRARLTREPESETARLHEKPGGFSPPMFVTCWISRKNSIAHVALPTAAPRDNKRA